MALRKADAVILKMFNWSESSRTVQFFTRQYGRLPLVDRAGRSFKSKRGRLQTFALMELTFYASEKQTTGYISDCDLAEVFSLEREGALGRLAYGSAACELLHLLLPEEEPQPALFEYVLSYFRYLDRAERKSLPALFLAFYLRLLSQLGYHPSLAHCVGCSKPSEKAVTGRGPVAFSPERGGIICPACQKPGEYYIDLPSAGLESVIALQRASLSEAAAAPIAFKTADRLVEALTKFLGYQAEVNSELRSLEFLGKLKESQRDNSK
jgi:DNA repair protein RecO (recombination protein O)